MSKLTGDTSNGMVRMMNTIRDNATEFYRSRIPEATAENISQVSAPLFTYDITMNEFLNVLVNRIGMTIVRNRELRNPLSVLKQGEMPLGKDIEDVWTNPAKATAFDPASTSLLEVAKPDTKAVFYRQNRRDKYKVSISEQQLRTAFVSWDRLADLTGQITNSLYSGNYLDEFLLCKKVLGDAIAQGNIQTATVSAVTDEASAKSLITKARQYFRNFSLPSSNYNSYTPAQGEDPVITWTPPEDIRFIVRSDVEAIVDVNVLAAAFNMDKAEFLGQTLVVDDFGTNGTNCLAMIIDKSFTQIYDNLRETKRFENGDTLTYTYFLHVWQTYAVSPLCNAVALVTA